MSIHHVCAVHGSTQNNSGRSRRLLICQFAATDAIQLDFRIPPNAFSNRIVRGAALTHARLNGANTLRLRGDVSKATSIFATQKTDKYN